ncbi:hypothetical protein TWF481_004942 [Arthrobotrys musiformis]|uniref:F-box domain-containing protein n=1 Tax=Arthrobotrys musiformis TaxID=47236 RepID=A0AAV9WLY2_9PEZI
MASFVTLPTELQTHILSFIPPWQLSSPRMVCSQWDKLIRLQLHKINYPLINHQGTLYAIHWLLYNNYHCDPSCQTCFQKYENNKKRFPTLSSATFKRVFIVGTFGWTARIYGYEIWIEKCSSTSQCISQPNADDFEIITCSESNRLASATLGDSVLRPSIKDVGVSYTNEVRGDPTFRLRYHICFPHCTTDFTQNPASIRNPPKITIPPYMTVRGLVDSTWISLKWLCHRFAKGNVRSIERVRLSVVDDPAEIENQSVLLVELDAAGACCKQIDPTQEGVSESIFNSRS